MKKNSIKILILFFILLFFSTTVFAEILTLNIYISKEKINVGDKIKVTVDWTEGMQAADFSLLYDSEKLEYIGSDLEDDFVNNKKGKVIVSWFSANNKDKTKVDFTFKAIAEGEAEFKTKVEGPFATGELKEPDGYNIDAKKIEISGKSWLSQNKLMIIIFIILILIFIIYKKNLRRKRNGKFKKS